MLSLRALKDLATTQHEEGWSDEEKYRFAAREIITFERDELSVLNRRHDDTDRDELNAHNYSSVSYWDKRYASLVMTYDWLVGYGSLAATVEKYLSKTDKILVPGCGNSEFSFELYDHGFEYTMSIDNSAVVIEQMQMRQGDRPNMAFEVVDVCETRYVDHMFDVVFDKSLYDCLLCGAISNVRQYLAEMNRVLKLSGLFIALSLHTPEALSKHMPSELWEEVEVVRVKNPSYETEPDEAEFYWISIFRKVGDSSPDPDYVSQSSKNTDQSSAEGEQKQEEDAKEDEPAVEGANELSGDEDDESTEDSFEAQDRRAIRDNPVFGTVGQGRDLFPSEEWIDLDGVLEKSYPAPADIVLRKKKVRVTEECPALNEQTLNGLLRTLRIAKVISSTRTPHAQRCSEGHAMVATTTRDGDYALGWHCERCGEGSSHGKGDARFHCTICPADACLDCAVQETE
eukprot:INCI10042.1.p1 GENE.INCI10042.1~~INCI10042.1.p1  ORF type:complete len:457 (-),score=76.50 INCI10042.1:1147-2517(-)